MPAPAVFAALFALAIGAAPQASDWVYFDSAETEAGPELLLTYADGTNERLPVSADSLLIEYLPERCWGRHARLSVDRADRNRVLLGCDPEPDGEVAGARRRLTLHQSPSPAREPLDVAI